MRASRLVIALITATAILLSGCGSSEPPQSEAQISSAASAAAANCPTDNTQTFPKARFALNLGLAAGVFHRWIYKPYQAGTFQSGAEGRTTALVKAGLSAAFIAKQVKDATENVKSDPTLCKALVGPLTQLSGVIDGLKDKVTSGDFASLATIEGLLGTIIGTSKQHGLTITEQTDESLAG